MCIVVKSERDSYRTKYDDLSDRTKRLEIDNAVIRERHDSRLAEFHRAKDDLATARDDYARDLQLLRLEYTHQLDHARERISELERLLTAQRVLVGAD